MILEQRRKLPCHDRKLLRLYRQHDYVSICHALGKVGHGFYTKILFYFLARFCIYFRYAYLRRRVILCSSPPIKARAILPPPMKVIFMYILLLVNLTVMNMQTLPVPDAPLAYL